MTPLQHEALSALRTHGGRGTTYALIRAGLLADAPRRYGAAFAHLARAGVVRGTYASVDSYGSPMVWEVVRPAGAVERADAEGRDRD